MGILRDHIETVHFDGLFDLHGETATYTPAGGTAFALTVLPAEPDRIVGLDQTRVVVGTVVLEARVSDFEAAGVTPKKGDSITHNGLSLVVQERPRRDDRLGLLYTLDTRRA